MGLLSTLLTGITVVGKVCQGIASAFGLDAVKSPDGVSQVYKTGLHVGGGEFYWSNEETQTQEYKPYILNTASQHLSVCLPDIEGKGGIEYLIPALKSREVSALIAQTIPPETQLLIGPVSDEDTDDFTATLKDTAVKLCVNRLSLQKKEINIGGFTISADFEKCVLYVKSLESIIGSMTYFNAVSESGISAEIQQVIYPDVSSDVLTRRGELGIGVTREYSIDFDELGFTKDDELCCRLYFASTGANAERLKKHEQMSCEPPAYYLDYLEKTGKISR